MHDLYVTAVVESLKAGHKPSAVFSGLKNVLARRGHERLLLRIVRTLERETLRRTGTGSATLTVAKAADVDSAIVQALLTELAVDEKPTVVIDETIIGGAKLRSGDTLIDATYKTTLINLYHTITK
ncbi:MAG: synthase delta subunit [Candidatus Parcubacteria bacterium]|jgi:F0F1-type ATP synthase delta subunit